MAAERIRVGIIGANVSYGWGTRAHIPAMQALPEFDLVAVCTTRKETAEETARRFGITLAFDDHRELVSHPDVDLVLVCVRVPGHHALVTAALEAGKHVFCEWPLGANTEQAVAMRDLAEAQGVRHMVGLQARGAPALNRMRALIADGYVGDVLATTMHSSLAGAGQRASASAWAADRTQGATTLTIAGGHSLDALCFCLGEFRELSATVSTQLPTATVTDTGETIAVTAADNVLVSGRLVSGAVASAHIKSAPNARAGEAGYAVDCRSCGHRNRERAARCARCGARLGATIESISAVTLVTAEMARAVRFYRSLGFELHYGGESETFTSFRLEQGYLNLMARAEAAPPPFWGRVILYVSDVDALYARALAAGQRPEAPPLDAEWGERYFHLADPDGHQLSFASPLST